MTEVLRTAEGLQALDQAAFDTLYQRVLGNRLPTDPWRQLVEAEQQRRDDLFRQNFDAGVHQ